MSILSRFLVEYKRKIVKVTKTIDDGLKCGTPGLVSFNVYQTFHCKTILGRLFVGSSDQNVSSCGIDEGSGT